MTKRSQLPQKLLKVHKQGVYEKKLCGKRSLKERVLSFAKRNRVFRAGDLLLIFDMKVSYAKWLIWKFKKDGVIVLRENSKRFEDRYYFYKGGSGEKS